MRKVIVLSAVVFCACMSIAAQQQEQGIYPGITYDSDILGKVNLSTGALAISHQVLSSLNGKGSPSAI